MAKKKEEEFLSPIVRHFILNFFRNLKKKKDKDAAEGKKYDFKKGLEKFARGAAATFIATCLAILTGKDAKAIEQILRQFGEQLLILIPLLVGFIEYVINAIKFFALKGEK